MLYNSDDMCSISQRGQVHLFPFCGEENLLYFSVNVLPFFSISRYRNAVHSLTNQGRQKAHLPVIKKRMFKLCNRGLLGLNRSFIKLCVNLFVNSKLKVTFSKIITLSGCSFDWGLSSHSRIFHSNRDVENHIPIL